jgi:hypothetical protein
MVYPQAFAQVGDTVRFAQSLWSMKKKEVVLNHMQLTEAQKAAFWPVYDRYSEAIRYLEMEYIQILRDYPKDFNDREKVAKLSGRLLQNDLMLAKVRKQYYRKFKKAISPFLASEFMQLDNSLRTMVRFELQRSIPSVEISQINMYSRHEQ